ncbi:hypothetical protein AB5I41_08200 [Sphingomonas sp. MMS24-JH45]
MQVRGRRRSLGDVHRSRQGAEARRDPARHGGRAVGVRAGACRGEQLQQRRHRAAGAAPRCHGSNDGTALVAKAVRGCRVLVRSSWSFPPACRDRATTSSWSPKSSIT